MALDDLSLSEYWQEWDVDPTEKVDLLTWEETDYKVVRFKEYKKEHLDEKLFETNGHVFARLNSAWVHIKSMLLVPINDWDEFDSIVNSYRIFSSTNKNNGEYDSTYDEWHVLMHMKFRGIVDMAVGKCLLSDKKNKQKEVAFGFQSKSLDQIKQNENIVFQYDIEECCMRNVFYNTTKRKIVNHGKPLWVA